MDYTKGDTTLMPFVTKDHRERPDLEIPGDLCYVYYKRMVDDWKQNPRWTTANSIYMLMKIDISGQHSFTGLPMTRMHVAAYELAWQVFFQKYVMEYENLKEKENGTI